MPAVKMVPIRNEDGQIVAQYFEPSNSFTASVTKNRMPMVRPDGRVVNVNKKLQARGHYDDKHGFTLPTTTPIPVRGVTSGAPTVENKEKVK